MQVTMRNPRTDDVRVVPAQLEQRYADRGWETTGTSGTPAPGDLKGAALDEALDSAGLPKSGTADEKRARYAEHLAGQTPGE